MKAVLTLRNIMVKYPFRLGTQVEFFNECSEASAVLSTVISCLKDHVGTMVGIESLVQEKLCADTYDDHIRASIIKFAKDFYKEQLKLADKAERAPSVVKLQVI
jgi:hypothetical protein